VRPPCALRLVVREFRARPALVSVR
jgi:hypothetical protein